MTAELFLVLGGLLLVTGLGCALVPLLPARLRGRLPNTEVLVQNAVLLYVTGFSVTMVGACLVLTGYAVGLARASFMLLIG